MIITQLTNGRRGQVTTVAIARCRRDSAHLALVPAHLSVIDQWDDGRALRDQESIAGGRHAPFPLCVLANDVHKARAISGVCRLRSNNQAALPLIAL